MLVTQQEHGGGTASVSLPGSCGTYIVELHGEAARDVQVLAVRSDHSPELCDRLVKLARSERGAFKVCGELEALRSLGDRGGDWGGPRLLDSGYLDSGYLGRMPFLVIPWLGHALKCERVDAHDALSESSSLRSRLRIARDITAALRWVHERGWVHADVCPSNVVVGAARSYLVDFGEAWQPYGTQGGLVPGLVRSSEAAGTPGYVAPERLQGFAWDFRADVYSLGCVLFQLFTGRPLFEGSDVESVSRQHVSREPPDIAELVPLLSSDVARLVMSTLHKDPWRRLNDVVPLIEALSDALECSTPRQAARRPVVHRSRLWGRAPIVQALERYVDAAGAGRPGAVLLLGYEGVGLTRLLEEVAHLATRRGLVVSDVHRDINEPVREVEVLLFDGVANRAAWRSARESWATRGRCLLIGTCVTTQGVSEADSSSDEAILVVPPLRREASRRMCRDILPGWLDDSSVEKVVSKAFGRPKMLLHLLRELIANGQLRRSPTGACEMTSIDVECVAQAPAPTEGELRRAIRECRRSARTLMTHDPQLALQYLETAFSTASTGSVEDARNRGAVAIGYQVLRAHSRAGDSNSVLRFGRQLLELCERRDALVAARVARTVALSLRVLGRHRECIEHLDRGLEHLEQVKGKKKAIILRERIRNRLDASWAHYADHDAVTAYATARSIRSDARVVGTPTQRASVHVHLANAIALRRRFAYSAAAVRHERRALAIHERHNTPAAARLAVRFELGFMLLLGDVNRCAEATTVLEQAARECKFGVDTVVSARIAAYLSIAYRRTRRLEDCERQSHLALEQALDCVHQGYVGVANACIGWVELRRGRIQVARERLNRAVTIWQRHRGEDSTRALEYPFQWLALIPLISVDEADGHVSPARVLDLVHPTQARLVASVDRLLAEAAAHRKDWSASRWDAWATQLLAESARCGYL